MKKDYLLNLLLLPFFFILHNYNVLFGFLQFRQIAFFLLYCFLLTGLFFAIVYFITKSVKHTAIATLFVMLFVLFFGPYHDFMKHSTNGSVLSSYKIVVPGSLLILFVWYRYLTKKPAAAKNFSRYVMILLSFFVSMEVVRGGINWWNLRQENNLIYAQTPICDGYRSCKQADSSKPDIYFLVFDAYTSNNVLQQVWHYDNSAISQWLAGSGFYLLPESRTNYTTTAFSVSSTFNMNYIDKRRGSKGTIRNYLRSNKSLSHNETFCLLQKEGYSIRFLAPYTNDVEQNGLLKFESYSYKQWLFMHTFFGRFKRDILWQFRPGGMLPFLPAAEESSELSLDNRIADTYRTINKIKSTVQQSPGKPKFVYGHLMITHDPHLFDSTGDKLPHSGDYNNNIFDTYTQQVTYANTVIKDLVSYIKQHGKPNTVIIIEGDHGFRRFPPEQKEYFFPIFNAIYFPDVSYQQLYPSMSPVNTFRVVFNHYFCQNLPLLKDSSSIITDYE